jgi:hypothetical protein
VSWIETFHQIELIDHDGDRLTFAARAGVMVATIRASGLDELQVDLEDEQVQALIEFLGAARA